MLYLIRSYGKDTSTLKLGYADNLDRRVYQYKSHNPFMELVDSREGDIILENKLHLYLHHLQYNTDFMYEWYKDIEEVKNIFNLDIDELDKKLWEIRDKVFPSNLFSCLNNSQMNIDIYKSLFDKFNSTLVYENTKDDNGKIVEGNACEIDKIYYHLYTIKPSLNNISEDIKILIAEFDSYTQFTDKMKFICDQKEILNELSFSTLLDSLPIIFKNYYSILDLIFVNQCRIESIY